MRREGARAARLFQESVLCQKRSLHGRVFRECPRGPRALACLPAAFAEKLTPDQVQRVELAGSVASVTPAGAKDGNR